MRTLKCIHCDCEIELAHGEDQELYGFTEDESGTLSFGELDTPDNVCYNCWDSHKGKG